MLLLLLLLLRLLLLRLLPLLPLLPLQCAGWLSYVGQCVAVAVGRPELASLLHAHLLAGVWLTAANVLALGTVSLLPIVSSAVEEGLLRWLRAAELTCDRAALLVAQVRPAEPVWSLVNAS